MNSFEWSPEKQKAFLFDRNLCVSAGAGSGKTAALVELNSRFLSGETHLKRLKMEQILAITFSEKAAGEMKERIRHTIEERIYTHLELEKDPERLRLWIEARQALLSAHISTFHSFCLRVLKEYPLEAGVDPLFSVAREKEASALLEDAARKLISRGIREHCMEIRELVTQIGQVPLLNALCSTYRKLRSSGGEARLLYGQLEHQHRECLDEFSRAKDALTALIHDSCELAASGSIKKTLQFAGRLENLRQGAPRLLQELSTLAPGDPLEALTILASLKETFAGKLPDGAKEQRDEIEELVNGKDGKLPLLMRFFRAFPLERALTAVMGELDREYGREKAARALLDFDDLVVYCRNLLRENLPVRQSCKSRFRVILVDEFQDTNELQREIVYLLAERGDRESRRAEGAPPEEIELEECKLFVVGDAKQSIYFFRGADVEVFSRVMDDVSSKGGEVINFQENFRTLEPIIEVINPLFAHLMNTRTREFQTLFAPGDHLKPKRNSPSSISRVEFLVPDKKSGSAGELRRAEAQALAKRITQLTGEPGSFIVCETDEDGRVRERSARWQDIALLFRSLTEVRVYEKALRAANIPYYVVKGRGFFRCQEVLDIMQVLRYISGIHRPYALAGILRSPLAGVRDETLARLALAGKPRGGSLETAFLAGEFTSFPGIEREKLLFCRQNLQRLEELKDRLSAAELIGEIMDLFEIPAVLLSTFQGVQKLANLEKLVTMARSFDRGAIGGIEDFTEQLERDVEKESREAEAQVSIDTIDAVKLMSIHQSKGLEFPVVIIPDMGRTAKGEKYEIAYSRRRGMACRFRDPVTHEASDHYVRSLIKAENNERDRAESLRLLYVALTRARDYLIISGNPGRDRESWHGMIVDFIGRDTVEDFIESSDPLKELTFTREEGTSNRPYTFRIRLLKASSLQVEPEPEQKALVEEYPALKNPVDEGAWELMGALAGPETGQGAEIVERAFLYRPPGPERLYLSPSSLMSFRFCQRKYLLESLMGKNEGLSSALGDEGPHGTLREARGWAAHKALEEMDFNTGGRKLDGLLKRLCHGTEMLNNQIQPIASAIRHFIQAPETAELGLSGKSTLLYREYPFHLSLQGPPRIMLGGAMDLLAHTRQAGMVLLDYKYSREKGDRLYDYRLQILSYALAVTMGLGRPPDRAFLVYLLDDPVLFREVEVTPVAIAGFLRELRRVARSIAGKKEKGEESAWKRTRRKACEAIRCIYRPRCWGRRSAGSL